MRLKYFAVAVLLFIVVFPRWGNGCTMVLVGKDATVDGSVLLAHNNDLPGHIASLIEIIPAKEHKPGDVIEFKNGLTLPQVPRTQRMLMMYCFYGFAEGDTIAVNEHQVALAGGVSLKADRNENARKLDPLVKTGVSGLVRIVALERAKTARECVEIIGDLYSKHGISYPSGVGIADPNEIWYIEAGGGKCWAARRVPDDAYLAVGNGYRIGNVDLNDKKNFIYPSYLKSYMIKKGLWKRGKKTSTFNFAKTFGGKKVKEKNYYDARRVWRAQQLLTPSFKQNPGTFSHPLMLKPGKKVTIKQLFGVLRDYYKSTPFEVCGSGGITVKGDSKERAIGIFRTVHTDVLQLRKELPPEIGAVMWAGVGSAFTTPYVPYYFGINGTPKPYRTAGPEYDGNSAFWHFRALANRLEDKFPALIGNILPVWQSMENKWLAMQGNIEKAALELYKTDKKLAMEFLTSYSYGLSIKALEKVKSMREQMETQSARDSDK